MGYVEDGNAVSDYTEKEMVRKFAIGTSPIPLDWKDSKINPLDTLDYFEFAGETTGELYVADGSMIFLDALSGVKVGMERTWSVVSKMNLLYILLINKMKRENSDMMKCLGKRKRHSGEKFSLPLLLLDRGAL
ncbi:MAG: GTP-binding protein [Bacillota bacterium]|nr:GTP-binding protein [Bacillota bacterium]